MTLIKPCITYLGFDDRKLLLFGIPILTLIMPFLVDYYLPSQNVKYWSHKVPESLFFVVGFWAFYRWITIDGRRRFPNFNQTSRRVIVLIAFVLLAAPVLKSIFSFVLWNLFAFCDIQNHDTSKGIQSLLSIYLPSGLIIAIYEAAYFFSKYRDSLIENERIETAHVQTQLDNLRNQINPHFLFNSLNTLMNLIPKDSDAAMEYLSKLSKFYRFSVGNRDEKLIELEKELECAKIYGDLLKVRFGQSIQLNISNSYTGSPKLLPLSLQLLIENAVKHNITSKEKPLQIDVEFDSSSNYIVVKNNLQRKIQEVEGTGMGLENISKRYSYFTDKPIRIENANNKFSVSLPLL